MAVITFDLETTGLDPKTNRIVSIAAHARGQEEFYTLVNPGVHIPGPAARVHGISNAMVRGSPRWEEAGRTFWAWVRAACEGGDVVFVGHNAARFDYPLLLRETGRMAAPPAWLPTRVRLVDTLAVCRAELRMLKSHRQAAVYEALFGEAPGGQHDALGDVRALVRIMQLPRLASRGQRMAAEVPAPRWGGNPCQPPPHGHPQSRGAACAKAGGNEPQPSGGDLLCEDPAPPGPTAATPPVLSAASPPSLATKRRVPVEPTRLPSAQLSCEHCQRCVSKFFKHRCLNNSAT